MVYKILFDMRTLYIIILLIVVLLMFACFFWFKRSTVLTHIGRDQEYRKEDNESGYWFDPIVISDNEKAVSEFILDSQTRKLSILYHIVLENEGKICYLCKFNNPFYYNKLNYIFEEDSKFSNKLYFLTEKEANDYIKENDIKTGSYVIAHEYSKTFCSRIRGDNV